MILNLTLNMTLDWVEYIGLAAGTLTSAAYLPQVWKTWRTKTVGDISLTMYSSMTLGILLWLVYGSLIKAPAVIAANAVGVLLVGGMLRMKIKYGRLAKAAQKTAAGAASQAQASAQASGPSSSQTSSQSSGQSSGQSSSQPAGPSLATQLGRGLRQLKERHDQTWNKN